MNHKEIDLVDNRDSEIDREVMTTTGLEVNDRTSK